MKNNILEFYEARWLCFYMKLKMKSSKTYEKVGHHFAAYFWVERMIGERFGKSSVSMWKPTGNRFDRVQVCDSLRIPTCSKLS